MLEGLQHLLHNDHGELAFLVSALSSWGALRAWAQTRFGHPKTPRSKDPS